MTFEENLEQAKELYENHEGKKEEIIELIAKALFLESSALKRERQLLKDKETLENILLDITKNPDKYKNNLFTICWKCQKAVFEKDLLIGHFEIPLSAGEVHDGVYCPDCKEELESSYY